jgi:glycosyltransferase involved in cell wall biosynthesis
MISGGNLLNNLKKECQDYPNITIVGWVSREDLIRYVSECIATIYIPIDEDFGISPIESMAAGKPVIGVNDGGIKETVLHGETGYLCPKNMTESDLLEGIKYLEPVKASAMKSYCTERAQKFKAEIFFNKMKQIMN